MLTEDEWMNSSVKLSWIYGTAAVQIRPNNARMITITSISPRPPHESAWSGNMDQASLYLSLF
jgi:hypothetical protein